MKSKLFFALIAVVTFCMEAQSQTIGTLTITGNYTQGSGASLDIEVAGTGGPGTGHDYIVVQGDATLDGTLNVTTSFSPGVGASPGQIGDSFTILTANAVSGDFATFNGRHRGNGLFYMKTVNASDVTLGAFQALGGDANGDRKIDITDFNQLATSFDPSGANDNDWTSADFNDDGKVDITDFNELAGNFSPSGYSVGTSQVPEPASCITLACGLLIGVLAWLRRRR